MNAASNCLFVFSSVCCFVTIASVLSNTFRRTSKVILHPLPAYLRIFQMMHMVTLHLCQHIAMPIAAFKVSTMHDDVLVL